MDQEIKAVGWQLYVGSSPEEESPSKSEIQDWLDRIDGDFVTSILLENDHHEVRIYGGLGKRVVLTIMPYKYHSWDKWYRVINLKLVGQEEYRKVYVSKYKWESEYLEIDVISVEEASQALFDYVFEGEFSPELTWRSGLGEIGLPKV